MVGPDQPHTTSVGMHEGTVRDHPVYTQRRISNLPRRKHQQQLGLLRQKVKFKKVKVDLAEGKE